MSYSPSLFSRIVFVILTAICLMGGAMMLSRFLIPKSAGLAGGPMVLAYGLGGFIIGLILAIFISSRLSRSVYNLIFDLISVLAVAFASFIAYKFIEAKKQTAIDIAEIKKFNEKHQVTAQTAPIPEPTPPTKNSRQFGLGMFKPILSVANPLYFYPNVDATLMTPPIDSITYKKLAHGDLDIATAPPYLVPAHLKLDYQIFFLKVKSKTKNFLEVIVNKKTGLTKFVRRDSGELLLWSDFLLNVFSVESKNPAANPIRIKPLENASTVSGIKDDYILQPLRIEEAWIQVKVLNENYEQVSTGWLRWHSDDDLLINYSLLS